MSGRIKIGAALVAVSLAFIPTGCGGSDAAEKLTEKAIEQGGGGDVDINSEDGTVKYTDENGNETEMNVDGEGASLPKDWPADLAPPDSVTLITSNTSTSGDEKTMTVLGQADGTVSDYVTAIKGQLEDAGYEITQDSTTAVDDGSYAGLTATKGDQEVTVTIASDASSSAKVSLTMTISGPA